MTATVRSVRVVMEADVAGYIRDMRLAGRETDAAFDKLGGHLKTVNTRLLATQKRLDAVGSSSRQAGTFAGQLNGQLAVTDTRMASVERSTGRASRQLDTFSGRAGILLKLAAGFGPALLPIGAIGVPALIGLATQGGFAAGALGATVLALRGVGDGVKALEKARLDGTVESMHEAQTALEQMGPQLASLVLHLDDLRGVGAKLQNSAAAGLVPGLNEALADLETGVPTARKLLREFGDITGDIAADAAGSITSDRWADFFNYLQTNARPILEDTADAVGNVAHAFASIFVNTSGDQRAFTAWLRDTTEDFDHWATRLDTNTDFQDFLAYARQNGPQVAETVGAIASAFAAVAEAAAPLGGPTLQILETIADVIDAIASSPIGTPIFTAISAYSLLSTTLPLLGKGYDVAAGGQSRFEGAISRGQGVLDKARGGIRGTVADLGVMASTYATAGARSTRETERLASATGRLKERLGPLVRGGAGLAGLAVATSGVADGIGLTNTVSGALIGTLLGPWGTAIGGAVGLLRDIRAASAQAADSIEDFNDSLDSGDVSKMTSAYTTLRDQVTAANADIDDITGPLDLVGDLTSAWMDVLGTGLSEQREAFEEAKQAVFDLSTELGAVGTAFDPGMFKDAFGRDLLPTFDQLIAVAERAAPAMQALGITVQDLQDADPEQLQVYANAIAAYTTNADSAVGRTQAVAAAIAALDDGMSTTAQSAEDLRSSLDDLLGPQLGLSAATDQWTTALRHLDDDLAKHSRTLKGNSDAAITNRQAIRDRVGDMTDVLVAEAAAGASSEQLSAKLKAQRQALIEAGDAANISKSDMRDYLNELGLTPALVRTLIQADTADAENKTKHVHDGLDGVGRMRPRPVVTVDPGNSLGILATLKGGLNSLHDRTVTITVNHRGGSTSDLGGRSVDAVPSADGGTVPGQRHPYGDRTLMLAAPGEEIISNRRGQADAFRRDRAAGRIPGYADGGTVARGGSPLFSGEGPRFYKAAYRHNRPFALDGPADWDWPYQTNLPASLAAAFEQWVTNNDVPFDPSARIVDYDMRGFWKKTQGRGWKPGSHFPDTWKTPYDTTFSHESKYATSDNPFYWRGDRLIDTRTGQVIFAAAAGGTVPGARRPYGDRQLILAAPGEEIISNRHGQADRYRSDQAAGRIPRYADGGTTGNSSGHATFHGTDAGILSVAWEEFGGQIVYVVEGLKELKHRLEESQKSLDKERQQRDDAISARNALASEVGGAYSKADPFAGGLREFDTATAANTNDTTAAQAALAAATGKGLDGPLLQALAASGNLALLQQFASLSTQQITDRENAYASQTTAQAALGDFAASAAGLDKTVANLAKQVREDARTNRELQQTIRQLEAAVERGAEKGAEKGSHSGTKAGTEGKNKTVASQVWTQGRPLGGGHR